MNRSKIHSSLSDAAPILVKEWHPTANGGLTPRNVNMGYPKKAWWLCSEGHEWQATIKSRLKRNECPNCDKAAKNKEADSAIHNSILTSHNRENRRFKTKATAVIELPNSGHWVYAEMTDISSNGIRLETEAAINPGSVVNIKFDKTLVSSRFDESIISSKTGNRRYRTYKTMVRWCKRLDENEPNSNFGIGVRIF
jgi:hypothetical protein